MSTFPFKILEIIQPEYTTLAETTILAETATLAETSDFGWYRFSPGLLT
jgi:hypothetical protein